MDKIILSPVSISGSAVAHRTQLWLFAVVASATMPRLQGPTLLPVTHRSLADLPLGYSVKGLGKPSGRETDGQLTEFKDLAGF